MWLFFKQSGVTFVKRMEKVGWIHPAKATSSIRFAFDADKLSKNYSTRFEAEPFSRLVV